MIHIYYHSRHKYFILNNYNRLGKPSKFMHKEYFKPQTTRHRADDIVDVWRLIMRYALYCVVQRYKVLQHISHIVFLFLDSQESS